MGARGIERLALRLRASQEITDAIGVENITEIYSERTGCIHTCLSWHHGPLAPCLLGAFDAGTMILREMSMPDGEVRLYCTRISTIISYFADDGEGGSVLWLEPGDMAIVQDGTMDEVRAWILSDVAQRLNCPPAAVETLPIETLCSRLKWTPESPRHPWQVQQRNKSAARRMSR